MLNVRDCLNFCLFLNFKKCLLDRDGDCRECSHLLLHSANGHISQGGALDETGSQGTQSRPTHMGDKAPVTRAFMAASQNLQKAWDQGSVQEVNPATLMWGVCILTARLNSYSLSGFWSYSK